MLFSDFEYFIFFTIIFIYQWYIHPILFKNNESPLHVFLLIASYTFYMSWDYRFGALIFLSTIIDYILAIAISDTYNKKLKSLYLNLSLFLNLVCILGFFKYYNFLSNSINGVATSLGYRELLPFIHITLPVGISFFTFQSLSYTIDVYRKVIPCERSLVRFALFVSFFPQLVAGPIVTAKTFLPQLFIKHNLENIPFKKAIRYFLLGYFKKVVLSDNISPIVDIVFTNSEVYGTFAIWLAMSLFIIQIYCDFSGYSDMAYGSALLLGFELPENFNLPFIATNITEFWRRWHLSLSIWLRDYIYISLGGSRNGLLRHKFNLFMTMFVAGIWHGANWTFTIWGSIHGAIVGFESYWKEKGYKINIIEKLSKFKFFSLVQIFITLLLFTFIGILFRSSDLSQSFYLMKKMLIYTDGEIRPYMVKTGVLAFLAVVIGHYLGYLIFEKNVEFKLNPKLEFFLIICAVLLFSFLTNDNSTPFIYFQF